MKLLELQDKYYLSIKRFVHFHVKNQWVAEDIVQETFLKAHKNFTTLKDRTKAKTWLYTISWNLCLNHFKKIKKEPEPYSDQVDFQSALVNIQQKVEQDEMGDCVQEKIKQLPKKLKLVLSLYDIERLSHKEISDVLNISVETAKTRLHRARKALKKILEKECSFQRDSRDIFVCIPKEDENFHK
jgi:RNA polymerase sigma-70 factor (ECF subfamily)